MKPSILLSIALLLTLTLYAGKVTTKGSWGSPTECKGKGICKVKTQTENTNSENSFDGTWELIEDNSFLLLTISGTSLDKAPDEIADEIRNGKFTIEVPIFLPEELSEKLGYEGTIVIRPGQYPVVHEHRGYVIRFSMDLNKG